MTETPHTETAVIRANGTAAANLNQPEWLAKRDYLLDMCRAIAVVDNAETLNMAGGLLTDAKKVLAALERSRKEITSQLDAVKKNLMDQERALGNPLLAEVMRLKTLSDTYATRLAHEAEVARQKAAQEAAEAQRRLDEAQAEAQRKAEEEANARRAKAAAIFGEQSAAEMVPEPIAEPVVIPVAPPPPPPPPPPKAEGARMVTRWSFRITDPNAVPREYCTVDDGKVRAWMQYQVKLGNAAPSLPGIEFTKSVSVESGR